ncbi:hypothetical protein [Streptomyces sp. NPDC005438]|uniref:hypothetical protein n=1 Tax=Streptomyces sp. NPDC005438 TaxID=3156880 RepID=UPI0033AE30B3
MNGYSPRHAAASPARPHGEDLDPSHAEQPTPAEGALAVAIRVPVRVVVLLLVVPVRLLWDALRVAGHALDRALWRPVRRALGWAWSTLLVLPLVALGRGLVWLWRWVVVVPVGWVVWGVCVPLGRGVFGVLCGVGRGVVPVVRGVWWVVCWPFVALWRGVLCPLGRGLRVLGRELLDALGHAWRVAGLVSRAVYRFLGWLARGLFVLPARWVYRHVATPLGHLVRDLLWRPAARGARAVGRAVAAGFASAGAATRAVMAPVRQALWEARASLRRTRAEVGRAVFGSPGAHGAPDRKGGRPPR